MNNKGLKEDEFIYNAAKTSLTEENISVLKRLSSENLDWKSFEKKSCHHGVDTFIYYSLKKYNLSEIVPSEIFKHFQDNFIRTTVLNSRLIEEFKKIAGIINDKIILLKGIDLVQNLYPDIGIRSMGDIDIMIEKATTTNVYKTMQQNGFANIWMFPGGPSQLNPDDFKSSLHKKIQEERQARYDEALVSFTLEGHSQHLPTLINKSGIIVELHWALFHLNDINFISQAGWQNAIHLTDNVYTLPSEIKIIQLCEHFYSHLGKSMILRGLCDVNEVIEKNNGTINWQYIQQLVAGTEFENALKVSLTLCNIFFNTPIPDFYNDKSLLGGQTPSPDFILKGFNIKGCEVSEENEMLLLDKYLSEHYDENIKIRGIYNKTVYYFRTFIPRKGWIKKKFHLSGNYNLLELYTGYWIIILKKRFRKMFMRRNNNSVK